MEWWFLFAAARGTVVAPGPAPPGVTMEIAFSFDTTGSMNSFLRGVRDHLQDIVTRLFADIPTLRISIMAHGDYSDYGNYVTKHVDLTNDVSKLTKFVKKVKSTHGGDWPECYELVLRQMQTRVSWAPGTKRVLVMIGDAVPHEKNYALNKERIDWTKEVIALRNIVSQTASHPDVKLKSYLVWYFSGLVLARPMYINNQWPLLLTWFNFNPSMDK